MKPATGGSAIPTFPPRDTDPAARGLECQRCGLAGDFSTSHVYHLPNGMVRRRRVCNHCGARLYTLEIPVRLAVTLRRDIGNTT